MTNQPTAPAVATPAAQTTPAETAHARKALLQDIRLKWGKFSEQELADLKSGDDLAAQVAAKYGLAKDIARRDVTALLNGRAF